VEIREIPRDDRRDFTDLHCGHRLGELISLAETRRDRDEIVDPMKIVYIEVADGGESFVLRSFRRRIADPLSYEVVPRKLMRWDAIDDVR